MEKGKIALLKGELDEQTKEIEKIYARIEERAKGKRRADIEGLSYWLHNLYCAFEDMFRACPEITLAIKRVSSRAKRGDFPRQHGGLPRS